MISPLFRSVSALTASEQLEYADYNTGQMISFRASAIDAIEARRADPSNTAYTGEHSYIDVRGLRYHIRASRPTVLADIAAIAAAASFEIPYVLVIDLKANGTDGGTFTSGAWRTRVLNTKSIDTHSLATLALNQLTLAAGTWRFLVTAPAYLVNAHRARLENVSDNTTVMITEAGVAAAGGTGFGIATLFGQFTIASAKAFEVQHWCETTNIGDGFGIHDQGIANNVDEYFTRGEFWRIAT